VKIAHFSSSPCGEKSLNGVLGTIAHLASATKKLGHDVHIFSCGHSPVESFVYSVPQSCIFPLSNNRQTARKVVSAITAWGANFVHLHSVYTPLNEAIARELHTKGISYTVTPNGGLNAANEKKGRFKKMVYRTLFSNSTFKNSAFIHSVGDTQGIKFFYPDVPVVEAPNGFDPELAGIRKKDLSLSENNPARFLQLLFIGRLTVEQKGLDLLLEALGSDECSKFHLDLAGPGDEKNLTAINSMIDRFNLSERVKISGPIFGEEKRTKLSSCDIFVHASRWEGMPLAVLEAAAVGCYCVVTEAADPMGIIKKTGWGQSTKAELETFRKGLVKAGQMSVEKRDQDANQLASLVKERFSWEKSAAILVKKYTEVLDRA